MAYSRAITGHTYLYYCAICATTWKTIAAPMQKKKVKKEDIDYVTIFQMVFKSRSWLTQERHNNPVISKLKIFIFLLC